MTDTTRRRQDPADAPRGPGPDTRDPSLCLREILHLAADSVGWGETRLEYLLDRVEDTA